MQLSDSLMSVTIINKGIDIWYCDIVPTGNDTVARYKPLLDATERARMDKFKTERLRQQYLGIRGRLRMLLANYTGTRPESIRFAREEYGKPFLLDHPELAFNISHSGNKLAVAIGPQCLLGIDIELWRGKVDFPALVEKCFADLEKNFWYGLPEELKTAVFYEYWTKKESFVKAVGRGIALGMGRCVVAPERPDQFCSIPKSYGPASDWKIFTLQLGEGISGAVSVRNSCSGIGMNYF